MKPFKEGMRYEYSLTPDSIIIEAGCHTGNWANEMWKKYGCRIYTFEPIVEFYKKARERFNGTRVYVFPYALGATQRTETMRVHGEMSGLNAEGEPQDVHFYPIDEIIDDINVAQVDLLALNCEGGEYEILECLLDTGLIGFVQHLQVQFHHVIPDAEQRRDAIFKRLEATHEMTYDEPWVWTGWSKKP